MSRGPDALFFKGNQEAFEYACAYLDNSLAAEHPVLAMVLAVTCSAKAAGSASRWSIEGRKLAAPRL